MLISFIHPHRTVVRAEISYQDENSFLFTIISWAWIANGYDASFELESKAKEQRSMYWPVLFYRTTIIHWLKKVKNTKEYRKSWLCLNKVNSKSFKSKGKQWNRYELVIHCYRSHSTNFKVLNKSRLKTTKPNDEGQICRAYHSTKFGTYWFVFSESFQNDFEKHRRNSFRIPIV